MALLNGKLLAGMLFAGSLFGLQADVAPAAVATGGNRMRRIPVSFDLHDRERQAEEDAFMLAVLL